MIFTIGYSNRSLPELLHELNRRKITQLWDVRSSPWSRNSSFNANQIERWSENEGIHYRQCGDVLGGRSSINLDDPRYIDALERLLQAACREQLVIMCAEGDPTQCHRTWDVGASLLIRHGIMVTSIHRDGRDECIVDTLRRVPSSKVSLCIRRALEAAISDCEVRKMN